MLGVMIVPTGVGAEIGGHNGDATPAAKLMASTCDRLIVHPNVVNASDINEMPANALYVEGSLLDRFLEGEIALVEPRSHNRILLVVNAPLRAETVNAVSAARATIGAEIDMLVLAEKLTMVAGKNPDGTAGGTVSGAQDLIDQVRGYPFDALAIATEIECSKDVALRYLARGGVNPWGGVEAIASRLIAEALDCPVAHAPLETAPLLDDKVVDPRIAPEMVSVCYLHSVLKGLHRAPRICSREMEMGLSVRDVSWMVSPSGVYGRPHRACEAAGIPVICVRENRTIFLPVGTPSTVIRAENYLEAVGIVAAMKAGVSLASVQRPLDPTKVEGR